MRKYWQFDYSAYGRHKTRYFYGTEAAVNSRIKRYECENKELKKLTRPEVASIKEQNAHIIVL